MRFQLSSAGARTGGSSVLVSSLLLVQILSGVAAAPVPATNELQVVDTDVAAGDAIWESIVARNPSSAKHKGKPKPKPLPKASRDESAVAEEDSNELASAEEEGDDFDRELSARGAAGGPRKLSDDKIPQKCRGLRCKAARSELEEGSTVTRREAAVTQKPYDHKAPEPVKSKSGDPKDTKDKDTKLKPGQLKAGPAKGEKVARDEAARSDDDDDDDEDDDDEKSTVMRRKAESAHKTQVTYNNPSEPVKSKTGPKVGDPKTDGDTKSKAGQTTTSTGKKGKAARDEATLDDGGEQLVARQTAGKVQNTWSGGSGAGLSNVKVNGETRVHGGGQKKGNNKKGHEKSGDSRSD